MKKLVILIVLAVLAAGSIPVAAETCPPLRGRVIILDPGHGHGNSPAFQGYVEHVRMLLLARKIRTELEARGATVILTRDGNADIPLPVRVALINRWSLEALRELRVQEYALSLASDELCSQAAAKRIAEIDRGLVVLDRILRDYETYAPIYMNTPFDLTRTRVIHPEWRRILELQDDPHIRYNFLAISLHSNATPRPVNTRVNGADIFLSTNCNEANMNYFANYSHADIGYIFADMLLDGLAGMGIRRREITPFHWMIIRETNVPAVLVENGFHTNAADRAKLSCNNFMARLAIMYANVIEEYFALICNYEPEPLNLYPGDYITLAGPAQLFANIGDRNSVGTVSPQTVRIAAVQGRWVQIETWMGPRWIRIL